MIVQFYAVQDKKVGAFMPVFQMRSRGEAIRSFLDALDDEKSMLFKHAEDYELFQVATFDDNTGGVNYFKPSIIKPRHTHTLAIKNSKIAR